MKVLLLNAGSSSLKAMLVDANDGRTIATAHADWAGEKANYRYETLNGPEVVEGVPWRSHADAVRRLVHDLQTAVPVALPSLENLQAVGHRVVHGAEFPSAVRITPSIRARIQELGELAPLHNPPSLRVLAEAEQAFPQATHVAVFDTAFHSTIPPEAHTYPIPIAWTREWGIRRYGFHGLSHRYCSQRAAELLSRPIGSLKLVICHLGHGCSASAVAGGRCVDTTMGFTPLEGLMMATRSGSIDPAIVTYVQERHGLTPKQVETALNRESGLLGVSEISGDMREVTTLARAGHQSAQLAVAIYAHRVRQAIGALAVTMGGVDALVFTAGVGEHSDSIRASVCDGLNCLGVELDKRLNVNCSPDCDIATKTSRGRILVIGTREEQAMFEEVRQVLQSCEK